ncbi:hypothetical protein MRX96_017268 [Rhipicephalus microplus]
MSSQRGFQQVSNKPYQGLQPTIRVDSLSRTLPTNQNLSCAKIRRRLSNAELRAIPPRCTVIARQTIPHRTLKARKEMKDETRITRGRERQEQRVRHVRRKPESTPAATKFRGKRVLCRASPMEPDSAVISGPAPKRTTGTRGEWGGKTVSQIARTQPASQLDVRLAARWLLRPIDYIGGRLRP